MANDNADGQFKLYRAIFADGLTVRASENKARQLVGRIVPRKNSAAIPQDPELRVAQEQLQERLGTKVIMLRQGKRGKIVVEFYSDEELRLLLRKLSIA